MQTQNNTQWIHLTSARVGRNFQYNYNILFWLKIYKDPGSLFTFWVILGTIGSDDSNDKENVKKAIGLISKVTNNLLVHQTFLCIPLKFCLWLQREDFYTTSCFMEDVKSTNKILLLFLNLDNAVGNSTPEEFAYI